MGIGRDLLGLEIMSPLRLPRCDETNSRKRMLGRKGKRYLRF